jgi:hypothetical protein
MEDDLVKFQYMKDYLIVGEAELKRMLRMVDAIVEESEALKNIRLSPQFCLSVRDQAVRIRSILSSRLVALEDLIIILREHGLEI